MVLKQEGDELMWHVPLPQLERGRLQDRHLKGVRGEGHIPRLAAPQTIMPTMSRP